MTYTATIYFLGKYRPLYLKDDSIAKLKIRLSHAIQGVDPDLRQWIAERSLEALRGASKYQSISIDHCDRGISIQHGDVDTDWIQRHIADLSDCPGLNYNA